MANRYALLMSNTIPFDETAVMISPEVQEKNLNLMLDALALLGNYGFIWPVRERSDSDEDEPMYKPKTTRNTTRVSFLRMLEDLSTHIKEEDLVLFYYFGHGYVANGELYLAFKKYRANDVRPLTITEVIKEFAEAKVKKLIAIIDCCHAGYARHVISFDKLPDLYLMLSTDTGYSHFDEMKGSLFTNSLAEALESKNSEEMLDRVKDGVTFKSWFDFSKKLFDQKCTHSGQAPMEFGKLGGEVIFPRKKEIRFSIPLNIPRRSIYNRLYELLKIVKKGKGTDMEIREYIVEMEMSVFRYTAFVGGRVKKEYISENRIHSYLQLAFEIGFCEDFEKKEIWEMTQEGGNALADKGSKFNKKLVEGIFKWLKKTNLDEGFLRDSIIDICQSMEIPDADGIRRRMIHADRPLKIDLQDLSEALRLLSYAGVIRKARNDTFYPL